MSQYFQRTVENFSCGHCGQLVIGNGYTNHCPNCLWSKHVDVHPGDRAAGCGGLMEPISLTVRGHEQIIRHRCTVCGHEKNNAAAMNDSPETLLVLSVKTT